MKNQEKIKQWIDEHNGYLVVHLLKKEIAVPYSAIRYYISNNNNLIKVKRGLYREDDAWEDIFYEISVMNPEVIFSHETALYFNEMIDREPTKIDISVYSGYNAKNLKKNKKREIHYVDKKIHKLGVVERFTIFGNPIKTYEPERALCDIVQNYSETDEEIYSNAWRLYITDHKKNFSKIMEFANKMRIGKRMESHLNIIRW